METKGDGSGAFISQDKADSRAGRSGALSLSRALKPYFQGIRQSSPSTALPLEGPVLGDRLRWELSQSGRGHQLLLQAWGGFLLIDFGGEACRVRGGSVSWC